MMTEKQKGGRSSWGIRDRCKNEAMGRLVFKQLMRELFFLGPFKKKKKNWESTIVSRLSGRRDILPPHHFFLLRESLVLHFNMSEPRTKKF